MYVYMYIYIYIFTCMFVFTFILILIYAWLTVEACRGPPCPPSVTNLCRPPLLQTLAAGLCVECCSPQYACRREGLSQDAPFCCKPCRKKAARASYKPDVFEPLTCA